MKILTGQVSHETNTFSNVQTTEELFKLWEWDHKEDIVTKHRKVRDYLGGIVDRAEELGIGILPTFSAFTYPSGLITQEAFQSIKKELVQAIREYSDYDAVCFAMHGAGTVDGVDDLEGELMELIRTEIGNEIPLVVTLDLHGNLTQKMVDHSDVLLGVNFYPHTDSYERGIEAVDVACQIVKGELKPTSHLTKLPMMIPTSTTNLPPAKTINEYCWEAEKHPSVIDCTFFHGFPYTDIPDVGVSIITTTNNDPELAKELSAQTAKKLWEHRNEFIPEPISPKEGIELALAESGAPIVINETSDNPGGGTPGDGTYLLEAMIESNLEKACFGYIYDPEVAEKAHECGAGRYIDIELGGKTDNLHGRPLKLHAYVKCLSDGQFFQSSPMWQGTKVNLGKSTRLVVNGVDIIVCSVKSQVLDEQIFKLHGIDVSEYKIVALKSSQHFRAAFEPITEKIITVDSPGLSTIDFTSFDYKRLRRPIFPLDREEEFADAKILAEENV
ncbi:M81 family metallopeptidase [Pseudalkalibacillus sp. A8]|uniref:M81 family metallopeptidase n=1 Tax=Pseudalkalibacillus sp. A8 TaxID=3382641 RepID=UPI0038B62E2A